LAVKNGGDCQSIIFVIATLSVLHHTAKIPIPERNQHYGVIIDHPFNFISQRFALNASTGAVVGAGIVPAAGAIADRVSGAPVAGATIIVAAGVPATVATAAVATTESTAGVPATAAVVTTGSTAAVAKTGVTAAVATGATAASKFFWKSGLVKTRSSLKRPALTDLLNAAVMDVAEVAETVQASTVFSPLDGEESDPLFFLDGKDTPNGGSRLPYMPPHSECPFFLNSMREL
jgi:hypothetical protein